jgi:thiamine-phosphate pyrophosphorylase
MLPRLHVVTDDRVLAHPDFVSRATALIERFGVAIGLHVRGRATAVSRLYEVAKALTTIRPAAVLVNDRVDLALTVPSAGVQLRQDSIPIAVARDLIGRRWIGYSAHSADEAREAGQAGADFVIAGSIYATASHLAPARGTGFLREVVDRVNLPVIAIGGIDAQRVSECLSAGAYGVAVIRAVWDASNPAEAAHALLAVLNQELRTHGD